MQHRATQHVVSYANEEPLHLHMSPHTTLTHTLRAFSRIQSPAALMEVLDPLRPSSNCENAASSSVVKTAGGGSGEAAAPLCCC